MPYIKQEQRNKLDKAITTLLNKLKKVQEQDLAGNLNYIFTKLLCNAFDMPNTPRYHKINTITGILECVKLEFYRRLAGQYENIKIVESGDLQEYKKADPQ